MIKSKNFLCGIFNTVREMELLFIYVSQTRHIAEHNALMLIKVSILLPKFGFGSYGTHPIPTLIVLNMHYSYRENKLHKVLMKNFLKNISSNHTYADSWFFKLKVLPDATSIGNKIENNKCE